MMCACEEDFANKYLPHQISFGTELNTKKVIPVTLGFQKNICNTCRGIPEEAYPKAPLYRRTSNIYRYYWREIEFKVIPEFSNWAKEQGYSDWLKALLEHQEKYHEIEREVVKEIKEFHRLSPKYVYQEESANEVLTKHKVETINLDGTYKTSDKGAIILDGEIPCSPEEFVTRHYTKLGYEALFTESVPFHALFGVLLWLLIQEPDDPNLQMISFGDRNAFESNETGKTVMTFLPTDFGTSGYAIRRVDAIEKHFTMLPKNKEEFLATFDYWVEPSADFRQYLWAHRPNDVSRAREIASILPLEKTLQILRYLVGNYWHRYCGWPDLLLHRQEDFFFAEVKSSNDKLSEDQKNWIRGNSSELNLPFKLVKVHKKKIVQ